MTPDRSSTAYDELDDFESDELAEVADADHGYLDSMWGGYHFRDTNGARDLVIAHGLVESFVNAFARDGRYVVSFDPHTETAGTDLRTNRVTITPAPVLDPKLTPAEAGRVLTALATHEISHARYGRRTWAAVQTVFWGNSLARRLSNVLDDVRIERRFVADYPGYAGIFDAAIDYIGRLRTGGLDKPVLTQQVNLAIGAIRYAKFYDWSDPAVAAERDWWIDWAARGSREDSPKRHVDFIREALAHIVNVKAEQERIEQERAQDSRPQPQAQTDPGSDADAQDDSGLGADAGEQDEEPTETPDAGADATDEAADDEAEDASPAPTQGEDEDADEDAGEAPGAGADDELEEAPESQAGPADSMDDSELNSATRNDPSETQGPQLGGELGEEAGETAVRNGADRREVRELREESEEILEQARNLEDDGHGTKVDVAKSLLHLTGGHEKLGPSGLAARYIRNAILRSRTGNTDLATHAKRGRLDNSGLSRVALGNTRIFENRKAPSPGKYNVWVMVDASGSMDGMPLAQAAQVAHAMAAATQGTPSVRLTVWAWSNPFRPSSAYTGVAKVWERGVDTAEIFRMGGLQTGGTPDSSALSWATRALKKSVNPGEQPVIIFVSDGAGYADFNDRVREAREAGVAVYGVSFGSGLTVTELTARFGKDNYVPFTGDIVRTAKPLAELFARIVTGKGRGR